MKDCGIVVENGGDKLKAVASGFSLEVIFLRSSDIPEYVADGVVHLGIVGENALIEENAGVEVVQKLGFSRCRLSVAVPKDVAFEGLNWLDGKRIATSYPRATSAFLQKNNLKANLHLISGSVEIAPALGLADAVCDLVSSGNTLFSNGLKEVQTLLYSEAVLIKNKNLDADALFLADQLLFRITSVLNARKFKYILLNCKEADLPQMKSLIPGMKSPSIIPLATTGWVSLHSVIQEDDFWGVIDQLKQAGAEGILVVPIEKMVF